MNILNEFEIMLMMACGQYFAQALSQSFNNAGIGKIKHTTATSSDRVVSTQK